MMKFGLLTAILDGWTFEEVVDIASEMGFKCLEVACWPAGKAEISNNSSFCPHTRRIWAYSTG